jgi:hypothetical protein
VIDSGGEFPVSIAASPTAVYVLNARGGASIQGYLSVAGHLIKVDSWNRPLGFDPDASPEFTSTPAQISFAPGDHQLIVTTKGDGSSIETFNVGLFGSPAKEPTVTTLAGRVPFGFDFDRAGHLVATEAGTNSVATFTLRPNGTLGQLATSRTSRMPPVPLSAAIGSNGTAISLRWALHPPTPEQLMLQSAATGATCTCRPEPRGRSTSFAPTMAEAFAGSVRSPCQGRSAERASSPSEPVS